MLNITQPSSYGTGESFPQFNYPSAIIEYTLDQRRSLVNQTTKYFQELVLRYLKPRLQSFYLVGSLVTEHISLDRPDINYLFIFKGRTLPQDYLTIGRLTQMLEAHFADKVSLRVEFRPFRYILPHYHHNFEISLNPILTSVEEVKEMGNMIFNPWFSYALKSQNILLFGEDDFLRGLQPPTPTQQILRDAARFDLAFFTTPLSRAPAQYTPCQTHLFLSESLINAKNLAYLGVEAAMTKRQLASHQYVRYVHQKEKLVGFYRKHYSSRAAKMVETILETRQHYLLYRYNPVRAEEIFSIAFELAGLIRQKLFH